MDRLGAGWIFSFQKHEKMVGCTVHTGLPVQQIWGCHGSAQHMWGHGGEAGLCQTWMRMRKKQHSALDQPGALDRAKTALGSTICSHPRTGHWVRLERGVSPNLQLGKGEMPPIYANRCLALPRVGFQLPCASGQSLTANSQVLWSCGAGGRLVRKILHQAFVWGDSWVPQKLLGRGQSQPLHWLLSAHKAVQ